MRIIKSMSDALGQERSGALKPGSSSTGAGVRIQLSSHRVSLGDSHCQSKSINTPQGDRNHTFGTHASRAVLAIPCHRSSSAPSSPSSCSDSNSPEAAKVLGVIYTTPDLPGFVWSQIPVNPGVCPSRFAAGLVLGWRCSSRSIPGWKMALCIKVTLSALITDQKRSR